LVLNADANDVITITDATVTAEVATQLRTFDAANAGFTIVQGPAAAGVFTISDTAANLTATANAAAVAASTDVRITGEITVAQAIAVDTAAAADTPTYNLADTYSRLVAGAATTTAATNVRITNLVTVAQANQAASAFGASAAELSLDIRDNASALSGGIAGAGVAAAETITLSTAATVAQAGVITLSAKLRGGYAIGDSATAVAGAINTANGVGIADRGTVLGAASIILTTDATVAEALGNRATEARGIYTLTGVSYAITDTAAAIITALTSSDALGIDNASTVGISDATVLVSQADILTELANFIGDDGLGGYDIADGFAAVQLANEALITNASSVRANGSGAGETIDMSAIGRAVYVNGNAGVDTMFGTDFADTMDGGTGADVMTGGNGADTFVFESGESGIISDTVFDVITDFTADDVIDYDFAITIGANASVAAAGTAAIDAVTGLATFDAADNTLALRIIAVEAGINAGGASGGGVAGETAIFKSGSDSYVFISDGVDGVGANDVLIKLAGVDVTGLGMFLDVGNMRIDTLVLA
jgi:hypothetical protein